MDRTQTGLQDTDGTGTCARVSWESRRDRDGQERKPVLDMYLMRILPTAGRHPPSAVRARAVSTGINQKEAAPHHAVVGKRRHRVTAACKSPGFLVRSDTDFGG